MLKLWPPDAKSRLPGKDPDAGKDWRREEKGTTEDEMVAWHHWLSGHVAAKSHQSCLTLCDPTDGSPPGSPVPGILQARTLEWVAISFSIMDMSLRKLWKTVEDREAWRGAVHTVAKRQTPLRGWITREKKYGGTARQVKGLLKSSSQLWLTDNAWLATTAPACSRKVKVKGAQSCAALCNPMGCTDSPGQNTGVGSLSLLQGTFPTQGLSPGLRPCGQSPHWVWGERAGKP